jgi:two-component system, NarL family, invasion response regulator UvrY
VNGVRVPAEEVRTQPLRVLLVDDQRQFRITVRSLLDSEASYLVVGEAADGEEAVELARSLRPDLVLMDVRLPGITGIEATSRIVASAPATAVVLMSTVRRAALPADLLHCGAVGFLQKEDVDPAALEQLLAGV